MADFMTAVKTVHKPDSRPEALLSPVSTQQTRQQQPQQDASDRHGIPSVATTPEDALRILRGQPDAGALITTLKRLNASNAFEVAFYLNAPGPLQAQIIHAIITDIVPTFWTVLDEKDKKNLISGVQSVAGLSALIARLRLLTSSLSGSKASTTALELDAVLQLTFHSLPTSYHILRGLLEAVVDPTKRRFSWREYVNLLGSGKVIAAVAYAEDVLKEGGYLTQSSWLSDGAMFSKWLGEDIANLCSQRAIAGTQDWDEPMAQLFTKSFSLGYNQAWVSSLMISIVKMQEPCRSQGLGSLLGKLSSFVTRQLTEETIRWLSTLQHTRTASPNRDQHNIPALSALIDWLMGLSSSLRPHLLSMLCDPALSSTLSSNVRRACLASVAISAQDDLQGLMDRLSISFGDQLLINHGPIVQQEALAQTLLLTVGYLHRASPMAVLLIARSSGHMQGVSNRLHSSNQRARWLGMVVGTALSSLTDKEGSRMSFGTEDMQTDEAAWYLQLVNTRDTVGNLDDFQKFLTAQGTSSKTRKKVALKRQSEDLPIIGGKKAFGPVRPPVQTEVIGDRITEVLHGGEDEEDDLKPYAKPDEDPEDSDEDATLVNRNKTRPPVYIRDLMRMLRDTEKADRFQMGIKHAATLIRKKANFGGEVKDHAEEIALLLCDLQDPFDNEDFDELKLQGLIAVLLCDITTMAPWLSKQAFSGEYSLSQRCIMLSALGLSGRELAGCKDEDAGLNPALPPSSTAFPSKRLPGRLHAIYNPSSSPVRRLEAASYAIEHQLIKPLALFAADKVTSDLDAVKMRTFSSRLGNDQRTKRQPAQNQLAKVFTAAFFQPLVSRYQQEVAAYGQGSVFTSAPVVIVTFLKTLALLFHASGPATVQLPDVTTIFWDLLLSLRVKAISDISILEAVLFSLLTILEVNSDSIGCQQRLAQENPKQLMETQQWVELVFERTGAGELMVEDSGEENRVRTLSAGVLVKCREVVEGYQRLLVGGTRG